MMARVRGNSGLAALLALALPCVLPGCALDTTSSGTPSTGDMNNGVDETPGSDVDDEPNDERPPSCLIDEDLASQIGIVAQGTTVGMGDDSTPHCTFNSAAPDVAYSWKAPFDDIFSFDTLGSDFDTVLSAYRADCEGRALACNDQITRNNPLSRIRMELKKGDEIVIVVDGYRGEQGEFTLTIEREPPTAEGGLCEDGFDNDRDGKTDCDDYECRNHDACL